MEHYRVETDHPIAWDSPDHIYPFGTMRDNSSDEGFMIDIERIVQQRPIRLLDLGCSGGKLVHDMLNRGHEAVGLEGSDYSLIHQRAEWPDLVDKALFTCDVTYPFKIYRGTDLAFFDVITAWEVLEHLPEERLSVFFENCLTHLVDGGWFIGSISSTSDLGWGITEGVELHQTRKSKEWWEAVFDSHFERGIHTIEHWVRIGMTFNFVLRKRS